MLGAFMLCALAPVALLSIIAYQNVSGQLEQQADDRLREESKGAGMMLLGRVALLGSQLSETAAALETQGHLEASGSGRSSGIAPQFRALTIERPGQTPELLWGQSAHRLPPLPPRQQAHLDAGGTALVTQVDREPLIYLVRRVRLPGGGVARLWGEAKPEPLWGDEGGGLTSAAAMLCLIDSTRTPLTCGSPNALATFPRNQFSTGTFGWREGGGEFLAGYWTVFLGFEYGAPPWTLIVSRPRQVVLQPLAVFRRTFLVVVLISLIVVFLLGQVQIRQTMTPVELLQEGTRRIAQGNFSEPVQVTSGDEFEALAGAFNQMAGELEQRIEQLDSLSWGALTALARTIDAVSPWTAGHSERVTLGALEIGRRLGLGQEELDLLQRGGLLHDIGKLGVPPAILDKPGSLTAEERAIVQRHTTLGTEILEPMAAFRDLIPLVLHHHEALDGSGYPHGLTGSQIPLLVRILTVSDVYDALVSDRPYRAAWPREEAVAFLRNGAGIRFDATIVKVFIEAVLGGWAPSLASTPSLVRSQPLKRGGAPARVGLVAAALEAQATP
jgi:putative nucleotidyltransferase with HDIG domain